MRNEVTSIYFYLQTMNRERKTDHVSIVYEDGTQGARVNPLLLLLLLFENTTPWKEHFASSCPPFLTPSLEQP